MNERIRHLKWLLVDQIVDLTTATMAIRDHIEVIQGENPPSTKWSVCYFRMCTTFLIVSLSKLWEALDHYGVESASIVRRYAHFSAGHLAAYVTRLPC